MPETNAATHYLKDLKEVVERPHHEIHEGNHYTAVRSTVVANAASFANFMLVKDTHAAGSRKARHADFEFTTDKAGTFYILENTGTTGHANGGTTYRPLNNNRNSTKESNYKYYVDGTTAGAGTQMYRAYIAGASAGPFRVGGAGGTRFEWILNPTKDYLLRFDPDNATTTVVFVASWYETDTGSYY